MSPADAIALPFIERDFETPSYDRKLALDRIRTREYKAIRKVRREMEKMHHMDYECKEPSAEALKAYRDFMCNPNNICNCAECPERGNSDRDCGLPCGQQNCWVECIANEKEEDHEKTDRFCRRRCNAPVALHPRARREKG